MNSKSKKVFECVFLSEGEGGGTMERYFTKKGQNRAEEIFWSERQAEITVNNDLAIYITLFYLDFYRWWLAIKRRDGGTRNGATQPYPYATMITVPSGTSAGYTAGGRENIARETIP